MLGTTYVMKCPHCGQSQSRVIDTRESGDGIRRRRLCTNCENRFTTYEQVATAVHIIKSDGRREPFDRTKLSNGIRVACAKRPIAISDLDGIVDQVEEFVHSSGRSEMPSSMIGNMILERLKEIDPVAYIRFATVYLELPDLESVRVEIDRFDGAPLAASPPVTTTYLFLYTRRTQIMIEPYADATNTRRQPDYVRDADIQLSANSREVLRRRYLRKGLDGRPVETAAQMFYRVASHLATADADFKGDVEATAREFYDLLTSLRFFPNSPTFTGAGTPLGQLAACFVLPIEDDMGKHPDGIFQTMRNAALIQQTGGGNGFAFSRLRPRSDKVLTSAGVATGPVGFLEAYDKAFGVIAQGGTRRGANMAVLRIDHPDIEEFIVSKTEEGKISNFNISVGITDAFMEAVKEDGDFNLINPRSGEVWRRIPARTLFDKIATYAHHNGEPGMLFLDTANRTNPVPHLYELEATNPCGEQWLGPYENCCLGSINLAQHLTAGDQLDWESLEQTVTSATRFLDDVVQMNAYVPAVPQLKEAALRVRRIGLGIMGLADVMYVLGVRYGSEGGQELAAQIMEFVRYHCMRTSIELARDRGPFTAIRNSIYDPLDLKWQPPTPLQPYVQDYGRPPLHWDAIVAGIKAHGIRNGAQTTIAPTGTIGTVTGCEGYGCEPVFALAYTRYVKEADGDVSLTYTSPLFLDALDDAGIVGEKRERIIDEILHTGTCQGIDELPESVLHTFVVSQDITPEEHVLMQAALQRFVDNSISKTCNFPPGAGVEDVKKVYFTAWELGCKGLTVYVTGSRQDVVLETKATAESKVQIQGVATAAAETEVSPPVPTRKRRPQHLQGVTYRQPTPLGTAYIIVNSTEDGEPFEVFLNVGKAGSDVAAVSEALGRFDQLCLADAQRPQPGRTPATDRLPVGRHWRWPATRLWPPASTIAARRHRPGIE